MSPLHHTGFHVAAEHKCHAFGYLPDRVDHRAFRRHQPDRTELLFGLSQLGVRLRELHLRGF